VSGETLAVLWALLSAVCIGLSLVTTQLGLRHLPAPAGARVSVPTTAVLMWLLAPWWARWPDPVPWKAIAIFAAVGMAFPAWVTLLTFEANRRLGPTLTGTISAATPLFTVIGAVLVLREAPTAAEYAGTAGVVAGVMLLTGFGTLPGGWSRWSLALPIAACVIRALAQVAAKVGLALAPQPFLAAWIGYTVSALMIIALSRGMGVATPSLRRSPGALWFAASGVGNGCAVLALYTALRHGPVSVVAPVSSVFPVITYGASMLLFPEERLGWTRLAGVAMVVGGVVLVTL
jgi:drug/metabolite transporter (DMT)-like permease